MSIHESTRKEIEEILQQSFHPLMLEVIDDSYAHRNHREARAHGGAGHFTVKMTSKLFDGKNRIMRHRMVYEKLSELMDEKIHALSLLLSGSDE
jgi:BolA protein